MTDNEYHDIVGLSKNFRTLLGGGQKFYIDFYQRDYKWTTKQLSELIFDLTNRFLDNHGEHDERPREAVAKYDYYFLGSIVVSQKTEDDGVKKYIIDGQQRLTTITLLLIYLNNLQRERGNTDALDDLIFSKSYGKTTFNIDVDDPERKIVMEALFNQEKIENNNGDESVKNILDRYHDIEDLFPAEIKDDTLLFFIDWLKERVFLVEITTYSDDDAYAIFETMNDRGLSLAPSDMLKGYLLANINQTDKRISAIKTWKDRTGELTELGERETEDFFKTWLRSQYADSIRERARGATAKDFDLLGTQYHRWIRANVNRVKLIKSDDFYNFVINDLDFYARQYIQTRKVSANYTPPFEDVYHAAQLGFTLQYPVYLAPLKTDDPKEVIDKKIRMVATYTETLLARRLWNWRSISYSTLQYNFFLLIKEIRSQTPEALAEILINHLTEPDSGTFTGNPNFGMHMMNRYVIHRLLARMTDTLERGCAMPSHYLEYINKAGDPKNPYEVEHIWANIYSRYADEFPQSVDFYNARNRIGSLLLLPKKFNAAYGALPYEEKVELYKDNHQNILAATLNTGYYERNSGLRQFMAKTGLEFKPYASFHKADQEERQAIITKLAEYTWRPERITEILN